MTGCAFGEATPPADAESGERHVQPSAFSPILASLPCTPMGTPGNTPTDVGARMTSTDGTREIIRLAIQQANELSEYDGEQSGSPRDLSGGTPQDVTCAVKVTN